MLDALGDFLNPYKDSIAAIAGTANILQSVSKVVFLNNIRKRGTADGFSAAPLLGSIVITFLNLELSFILGDVALVRTNVIMLIINITCMSIFYYYISKQNRPKILKQFAIAGVFVSACIIYAMLENPANIKTRFVFLLTAFLVFLLGLPLLSIGVIIKKKSSENLPFPMILTGTFIGLLWLTYAVSIKERILMYQQGFFILLLSPQLIVCLIYPRTPTTARNSNEDTKKKN